MADYVISNALKKSVFEIEHWIHPETKNRIDIETCWRSGTYTIHLNEGEDEPVNGQDGIEFEDYEDWELDSTWDGYYTELHFYGDFTEEQKEEIKEGYSEDWSSYLEETLGYDQDDLTVFIEGEITVEKVQDEQ